MLFLKVNHPRNVIQFFEVFQNFQFTMIPNFFTYFMDVPKPEVGDDIGGVPLVFLNNGGLGSHFLHNAG